MKAMQIQKVFIDKDKTVIVEYIRDNGLIERHYPLNDLVAYWITENLTSGDFDLLDFIIKDKAQYWEINVVLYSKDGKPVLLDNIVIDEDFIKHS